MKHSSVCEENGISNEMKHHLVVSMVPYHLGDIFNETHYHMARVKLHFALTQ